MPASGRLYRPRNLLDQKKRPKMLSLIIKVAVVSALILTVSSEEVDVVEAVPGLEVQSEAVDDNSNQAPVAAAQNREDPNEGGGSVGSVGGGGGGGGGGSNGGPGGENDRGSDQLALESTGDQEAAASGVVPATATAAKHTYVPPPPPAQPQQGPPRGHPLRSPPQHKPYKQNQGYTYHGPPPPPPQQPPPQQQISQASEKHYGVSAPGGIGIGGSIGGGSIGGGGGGGGGGEEWPITSPDTPKIISLDVKCEKSAMKVFLSFDKPFYGVVFSKGHFSNVNCVHLPAGLGRTSANFEISIHACGTAGNTENGLYGYGADSGSGTYFENIIVIQYDPQVQEVWDQARKLRCTWHDQYEKSVTFRPFPVDMLDVVRADFAGDNVGCWMQIQMGKGPWASEVSGLVKIGQTMTMVLAIKDDDSKFDMLVRNCMAHDGKRAPIQLVDHQGCVTRPKLMSRFNKIKNFGASASVLSYAHFQAFKFPDSMEVHFQCTIQICRHQCPDQCSANTGVGHVHGHVQAHPYLAAGYGAPAIGQSHGLEAYLSASTKNSVVVPPPPGHGQAGRPRDERRVRRHRRESEPGKEVGLNRIIRVVSTGDLTFPLDDAETTPTTQSTVTATLTADDGLICMTTPGFAAALVVLLGILFVSCLVSALLCLRLRIRPGKQAVRVPSQMTAPPPPTFVAVQTLPAKRPNAVFYS